MTKNSLLPLQHKRLSVGDPCTDVVLPQPVDLDILHMAVEKTHVCGIPVIEAERAV